MTTSKFFDVLADACRGRLTAIAYLGVDRSFTFGELIDQARSGSARINSAAPRGPVAVVVSEPAARVPAVVAVAAAGRTLIPLDPEWPERRKTEVIEQFACAAVLADEPNALGGEAAEKIHLLDAELFLRPVPCGSTRSWHTSLSRMHYVLFTSGSTGQPKGVGVSIGAALQHINSVIEWLELSPKDRVYQFARLAFDTSQEEIWPALFAGATLVSSGHKSPTFAQLQERLSATAVTLLELPTAYWRQWAYHLRGKKVRLEDLRTVVIGGEAAYERDAHAWQSGALAATTLINSYGPTEAGITASAYVVPPGVPDTARPLPIGRPLPGRLLKTVAANDHGHELLISGATLADGYFTEGGLVQHGFVDGQDGRWYRTGDLVENSDGDYVFVGRADRQVKFLGRRIELESIEAALLQSGAGEARVEMVEDSRGRMRLCAAVGGEVELAELKSRVSQHLPAALVPSRVAVLKSLPKNAAGKIDVPSIRRILGDAERSIG